jgi:NAD(P)H dehydrogenase (quinone)
MNKPRGIMRIFIVHAHHEPTSFNSAMTNVAITSLRAAGHEVVVSDLYAMSFDPVSDRRNFITVKDPRQLKQQNEESYASENNGFVPEIQVEMDKLMWCDALILQFPLWWLGLPAILKGWVDRVLAVGRAYGGGRYFSRGVFSSKRAMCSVTLGGSADAYSSDGAYGPLAPILFPINHGILGFVGFTVVEPFVVHAPARMHPDERAALLADYRNRLLSLATASAIPALDMANYDGLILKEELRPRIAKSAAPNGDPLRDSREPAS